MKCSICDYRGHTEDHHIQSKSLGDLTENQLKYISVQTAIRKFIEGR